MKLIVTKFGGTSVGTIDRIKSVATRIKKEVKRPILNSDKQIIFALPPESKRKRTDALRYIDKSINRDEIEIILVDNSEYVKLENIICNKNDKKEKLYYKNGSIVKV